MTTNGKGPITAEQLRELKPLTAGDFYWGHKNADKLPDGTDDTTDLMIHTTHHAATRVGLADKDDLYGFLDRIELNVLTATFSNDLMEEETGDLVETPTGS